MPDVEIIPTLNDRINQIDPELNWLLEDIKNFPIMTRIISTKTKPNLFSFRSEFPPFLPSFQKTLPYPSIITINFINAVPETGFYRAFITNT